MCPMPEMPQIPARLTAEYVSHLARRGSRGCDYFREKSTSSSPPTMVRPGMTIPAIS